MAIAEESTPMTKPGYVSWLTSRQPIEESSNRMGLLVLAIALVIFFEVYVGGFATTDNMIMILTNLAPTLIAAMAASRLLITGNVDLSIAGSYALLSVICGLILNATDSTAIGLVGTFIAGGLLGLLNGSLVRALKISPIIVTLGLMGTYTGAALVLTNGASLYGFPESFTAIGQTVVLGVPSATWIAALVFIVSGIVLHRTVSGMRSYAIGGNPNACRLVGIKVDQHVMRLYVTMGLAMALVAIITNAQIGSASPTNGVGFEFDVLTAAILGGIGFAGGSGRAIGVFAGVATLGILQAGFVYLGLNSYWQLIARGMLLLLALGVDQIVANRKLGRKVAPMAQNAGSSIVDTSGDAGSARRTAPQSDSIAMRCANLAKSYGSVAAVKSVSFEVKSGEVVCLVGDNGAGKSSVIKLLSGVVTPDTGTIEIDGRPVQFASPANARDAGVETVYQDLALCANLGTALNLTLGREPTVKGWGWLGILDRSEAARQARIRLGKVGVALDNYFKPVNDLSGGQRQSVAIARSAVDGVRLMILDEPTAALGVRQKGNVLSLVRRVADTGAGVILISHDVKDVMAVADRIVVLRLGTVIFDGLARDVSEGDLIHLMAGYHNAGHAPAAATA
ncbi:ATP-binding cassette domain-containing protein [Rhizobium sp.]